MYRRGPNYSTRVGETEADGLVGTPPRKEQDNIILPKDCVAVLKEAALDGRLGFIDQIRRRRQMLFSRGEVGINSPIVTKIDIEIIINMCSIFRPRYMGST